MKIKPHSIYNHANSTVFLSSSWKIKKLRKTTSPSIRPSHGGVFPHPSKCPAPQTPQGAWAWTVSRVFPTQLPLHCTESLAKVKMKSPASQGQLCFPGRRKNQAQVQRRRKLQNQGASDHTEMCFHVETYWFMEKPLREVLKPPKD